MKAEALDLRIVRLTIDRRLAGRGRIAADVLAEAVQSELAAALDGRDELNGRHSFATPGNDTQRLARTIAGSVAERLPSSDGMKFSGMKSNGIKP